ncbi:MAG: putative dTDP-4-dehydrorhamnose reductase [Candidatus Roizmanbacteria bacterium GW2011_GWC2_34_23]|uniref:dTDP-4-dehydrorhamnose reductase n=1 Tax=Candidatus Roizmanbacteria bacterium GW2011_GWC2_34_23 TaxID=1618484 RepID=A0A0G0B1A8_9BACT|nr:MAG: putative dTDP-4-dehydrorhamnose reductase [Candidatus Roizmanbacteria bacterium GW2011_GWC2_34_23]
MLMLKIALTGADGLVGSRIVELLKDDFEFIPLPQKLMDITNKEHVDNALKNLDFNIFFHLAAFTNVPGAETNKELCFKINRDGTKNVYEAVKQKQKKFIYVSTDFVFDGISPPYNEDSLPNPIGVYALSKYEGEKIVNPPAGGQAMIVRIAYPYRTSFELKKDFFRTFKFYLENNKPLSMITDSLMTPTFIDDIAYGLKYLFNNYKPEIYHLVGSQSISPYDAAMKVAETFNLDKSLIGKTTYEEYILGKARLPQFATIKSNKNNFWKMKTFGEGLDVIKKQISK